MCAKPIAPFRNGRKSNGRFAEGNPGNPDVRRVAMIRRALYEAVTPADIRDVVRKILARAKEGDAECARLLFDRLIGRPVDSEFVQVRRGKERLAQVMILLPHDKGVFLRLAAELDPEYARYLKDKE